MKKTAQEIWDRDKRIKENLEKTGYRIITIWESSVEVDAAGIQKLLAPIV